MLPSYSVAIRTLGTSGDAFRRELESLHKQTILPQKIVVYIADGYNRPDFQIGMEEYVWVKKGLVAQRALEYREIGSEYILLLDDDVELAPSSAEILLKSAVENNADVVGADTFRTHELSFKSKVAAIISNWVFPHDDQNWAFKLNSHGSFSYLNNPKKDCYRSQSCAGPASLWKKNVRLKLHFDDEVFLDSIKHMTEDQIMFGKVHFSGYKLYVHYNSGIKHLDARVNSKSYDNDSRRFYYRSRRLFVLWWRTCFERKAALTVPTYVCKSIWLGFVNLGVGLITFRPKSIFHYVLGIIDGWKFVHSDEYKKVPKWLKYKKAK